MPAAAEPVESPPAKVPLRKPLPSEAAETAASAEKPPAARPDAFVGGSQTELKFKAEVNYDTVEQMLKDAMKESASAPLRRFTSSPIRSTWKAKSLDADGTIAALPELGPGAIEIAVDAGGAIWGTGDYQQLDPGWLGAAAAWFEHLILGKYPFPNGTPPVGIVSAQVHHGHRRRLWNRRLGAQRPIRPLARRYVGQFPDSLRTSPST